MTSITRTALDKCSTKECPFSRDEHDEWMERCANGKPHGHRQDQPTHAHFPKKGMGGNNPKSRIVAVICWPLHDSVDNGLNGMGITLDEVRVWDIHNETILRGPALSGVGEELEGSRILAATRDTLPIPPSAGESDGGADFSVAIPGVGRDGGEPDTGILASNTFLPSPLSAEGESEVATVSGNRFSLRLLGR